MRSRQIELLVKVAAVITMITAPITGGIPILFNEEGIKSGSESDDVNHEGPMIATCLRIAPNLPPCDFDTEATWRSANSGEIFRSDPAGSGYPINELPDFFNDQSNENILGLQDGSPVSTGVENIEEYYLGDNHLEITVVYYLEGCLPTRLPFDLPSCPIDESKIIQMNKLVPFQLPGVEDALIFPEIDVKQIEFSHRQSFAPSVSAASQSYELQDPEEENGRDSDGSVGEKSPVSFQPGNENGLTFKGVGVVDRFVKGQQTQDLRKTIAKSSTTAKIGTASTKYVIKLPGSGSTLSSIVGGSGKKSKSSKASKILEVEGIYLGRITGMNRKEGDTSIRDKTRVQ